VTGGSGFIGSAFVRQAIQAGHNLQVLSRTTASAERVRQQGAEPIVGDLNKAGPWQASAATAPVVVHLAQPETYGTKVTRQHAEHQLEPLAQGKTLVNLRRPDPVISVVHVDDVARALLHLIDQGVVGKRYFVADNLPLTAAHLAELTAQAMQAPLHIRRFPVFVSRLMVGPIVTDSLNTESRLSNARIKQTGFDFRFPTSAEGVPDAVAQWRAKTQAPRQ